jgi:hypothetical protein
MFEELVRPFERPSVISTGKRIPVTIVKVTRGVVEARWGDVGTLPKPQSDGIAFGLCNEQMTETDRQTETVRIENPDDSSQFIMVKRAKQLKFDKTTNQAPVLNSDFNIGTEAGLSDFSTAGDGFVPQGGGGSTDHCQLTVNLNNNTSAGS